MGYRPVTDLWFLARCKYKGGTKRYGGYVGGFLERARVLIGCPLDVPMLHACGGLARLYPYAGGFGKFDQTMDLDPAVEPDFLQDVRDPWPQLTMPTSGGYPMDNRCFGGQLWGGILIDPPYSPEDAEKYSPGRDAYPTPNQLMRRALEVLPRHRRVGLLHYGLPAQPKGTKFTACVAIYVGFNNRSRTFSVFEKL